MNRRHIFCVLFAAWIVMMAATGCFIKRAPGTGSGIQPPPVADTAPPPEPPRMIVHKVSGSGNATLFAARVEWTGVDVAPWTIKRWTIMRDKTAQTQSMLVVETQTFEIKPGEVRTLQVRAVPLDPDKPPARHLIVDYEGMPEYELTTEIASPTVKTLAAAIERVDLAVEEMLQLVEFVGQSIEYKPEYRDKVEPYLAIVVWEFSGEKPRPYIEKPVIEASVIVGLASGMNGEGYAAYLQKKLPGLSLKDAKNEAKRIRPRVNALLEMAGLDARLER
ncbi:MAG: hypothetical protein P9L99_02350 [Candidatus Lernaella stagnicola]|nr:hypothetical protein [Candidatus Lernaella stagnicola]